MKAKVGDFLVVKGTTTERHDQHAEIIEVRSQDGSPPYVVRWLVTDHEATVYPGCDAVVVTAAERYVATPLASRPQGGAHQHHAVGRPPTPRLRESSRCRPRLLTGVDAGSDHSPCPHDPRRRSQHRGHVRCCHAHMHPAGSVAVLVNLDTTPVQLRTKLFQTGDPPGRGISSYLA